MWYQAVHWDKCLARCVGKGTHPFACPRRSYGDKLSPCCLEYGDKFGLYCLEYGDGGVVFSDMRILRGILHDNLGINEGMFFENAVAQMLVAQGYKLRFYSRKDIKSPRDTMEIDFLVKRGIKVVPIEVKSGRELRRVHHPQAEEHEGNNPPRLSLEFYAFDGETFADITETPDGALKQNVI